MNKMNSQEDRVIYEKPVIVDIGQLSLVHGGTTCVSSGTTADDGCQPNGLTATGLGCSDGGSATVG